MLLSTTKMCFLPNQSNPIPSNDKSDFIVISGSKYGLSAADHHDEGDPKPVVPHHLVLLLSPRVLLGRALKKPKPFDMEYIDPGNENENGTVEIPQISP